MISRVFAMKTNSRFKPLKQQGFTLIEIMITLAILAIISIIAVPGYKDYVVRTQVTEALSIMEGLKIILLDYYHEHGECPGAIEGTAAGRTPQSFEGKYVEQAQMYITPSGVCEIKIHFKGPAHVANEIAWRRFAIDMIDNGSVVKWQCPGEEMDFPDEFLPKTCR